MFPHRASVILTKLTVRGFPTKNKEINLFFSLQLFLESTSGTLVAHFLFLLMNVCVFVIILSTTIRKKALIKLHFRLLPF